MRTDKEFLEFMVLRNWPWGEPRGADVTYVSSGIELGRKLPTVPEQNWLTYIAQVLRDSPESRAEAFRRTLSILGFSKVYEAYLRTAKRGKA